MPTPLHQVSLPALKLSWTPSSAPLQHCYREGGFRLQQESLPLHDKQIFHNYGQGEAEFSLSYGCSYIISKIITVKQDASKIKQVAVMGHSVNALMTALELVKRGYKVCLYADKPMRAADGKTPRQQQGLRIWYNGGYDNCDPLKHELVSKLSYQFLKECLLANRYQSLRWVTCYCTGSKVQQLRQNVTEFINEDISPVLVNFGAQRIEQYVAYKTIMIDTQLFMEQICTELKLRNVTIVEKQFHTLEDVFSVEQKYIFNCLGQQSKGLFKDQAIKTTRGCYYSVRRDNTEPEVPVVVWVSSEVEQDDFMISVAGNRMEISMQGIEVQEEHKVREIGEKVLTRAYHFVKERTMRPHKL